MSRGTRSRRTSRRGVPQLSAVVIVILLLGLYALVQFERSGTGVPTPSGQTATPANATPAPGAATAPPAPGATWYQVYFTTPRYPDKKEYHSGGLDAQLVAFINTATMTIDLADYDFDLEN